MNPNQIKKDLCNSQRSRIKNAKKSHKTYVCDTSDKYKIRMLNGVCPENKEIWYEYIKQSCKNWNDIIEDDSENHLPKWGWAVLIFTIIVGIFALKYRPSGCKIDN